MKIAFRAIMTVDAALKAVQQNGEALQYVWEQTEAVCLQAVEADGHALQYIIDWQLCLAIAEAFGIQIDHDRLRNV